MKKKNIVQYTADELPKTSKTDWKQLDALSDDEIDTSDIPELDVRLLKGLPAVTD